MNSFIVKFKLAVYLKIQFRRKNKFQKKTAVTVYDEKHYTCITAVNIFQDEIYMTLI